MRRLGGNGNTVRISLRAVKKKTRDIKGWRLNLPSQPSSEKVSKPFFSFFASLRLGVLGVTLFLNIDLAPKRKSGLSEAKRENVAPVRRWRAANVPHARLSP